MSVWAYIIIVHTLTVSGLCKQLKVTHTHTHTLEWMNPNTAVHSKLLAEACKGYQLTLNKTHTQRKITA